MLPAGKLGVLGALAVVAAALIPSSAWIGMFRDDAGVLAADLLKGAALFRIGLAVLGLYAIALAKVGVTAGPHPDAREPVRAHRGYIVLLALILAAAFGMRLYRLGSGLWLDEILTYVNYARMPYGEIASTYASENQHFLYSLMAHWSFGMFGESPWALRLPAVIFGVGGILALYLLGREVASPREGVVAAALLAFSYHHVWFSQNARGYTGLLFWTLLSSWLYLRALRTGRLRLWFLYAAAAALGVYTHITMLFVIAGQFLSYSLDLYLHRKSQWPGRWAGLLVGFCGAGLLTYQLHALVIPQVLGGMSRTVSVVDAWKKPLWTLIELANGLRLNFAGGAVGLIALIVFAAGMWSFARSNPRVLHLLFLPPILGAALVLAVGHHLWPRFFFFAFGFAALVVVRGLGVFERAAAVMLRLQPRRAAWLGAALACALVTVSAASVPFAFGPKQDYEGALEFARAATAPGDAVVSVGLASFPYANLYTSGLKSVETLDDLNTVRAASRRTLLLYTLEPVMEEMHPEIMETIRRDFKVLRRFPGTLAGGTVIVCIAGGRS